MTMTWKDKWEWIKGIILNRADLNEMGMSYIQTSKKLEKTTAIAETLQHNLKVADDELVIFFSKMQQFIRELEDVTEDSDVCRTVPKWRVLKIIEDHGLKDITKGASIN